MTAPIQLDLDAIEAAAKAALPGPVSTQFLEKTNSECAEWMGDFYTADAIPRIDRHCTWAWQEQERRHAPVVLELISRLRTAEGAARYFYAKRIADGRVLDDETCGEFERQELAVPDIGARVVPADEPEPEPPYGIEVDDEDENFN